MSCGRKKILILVLSLVVILSGFSNLAYADEAVEAGEHQRNDVIELPDFVFPSEESYTIIYKLNGGTNHAANPSNYTKSTSTITLEEPVKAGYVFKGWYSDKNYTKQIKYIKKGTTGNKTLYAKWSKEKYSITYHLNGGENNSKNPSSYQITTENIKLQNPVRTGYVFEGWYSDASYTNRVKTIPKGSTGERILYAKWKAKSYKITYKLNGGKNNDDNPTKYTIETESITLENPRKAGYKFKGWYKDSKYKQQVKTIKKGSTGTKTLYAKWETRKYTIKYKLDGGKNNSKNPSSYRVTTADIKLQKPSRSGYTFKGWYLDNTFAKESKVTSIEKGSTGNKTLYARWEPKKYTITYHLNKGTNHEENPRTYTMKEEVIFREPTRKGYTFSGWYKDKKLTKRIISIPKGKKGKVEVYAKWTKQHIGAVELPDDYLNVLDYGATPDDKTNDTKAFFEALLEAGQNALYDKGCSTVYVPAGVYRVSPSDAYSRESGIYVWSNTKLIMDNEAILYVEGSNRPNYAVIKSFVAENITIQGGKIQGERYSHKGNKGESGHGISILGCKNVVLKDMFIASNWGDGIYLGTWYDSGAKIYTGNKKITVKRCEITDNRRNNISIIDADNVTIERCYISDAHGTAPQCGICIEPNKGSCSGDEICSNILIKDTTITAYLGKDEVNYWCFMTTANGGSPDAHPEYVTAKKIKFENCKFNGYVGNYSGNQLTVDKKTKFNGTFVNWR